MQLWFGLGMGCVLLRVTDRLSGKVSLLFPFNSKIMQVNNIGGVSLTSIKQKSNNVDAKTNSRTRPHYKGLRLHIKTSEHVNLLLCELYTFKSQGKWVW